MTRKTRVAGQPRKRGAGSNDLVPRGGVNAGAPHSIQQILEAMRAEYIPEGESGLWSIKKTRLALSTIEMCGDGKPYVKSFYNTVEAALPGSEVFVHTILNVWTTATLHHGQGETVMEDSEKELRKHLDFILRARGRVLVLGLGLGCVVRGLMKRREVRSIDVVERERDVIDLVSPCMPPGRRIHIHHADAERFIRERPLHRWDYAWHDLWSDEEKGEPNLQVTHGKLMAMLRDRVGWQGAWDSPAWFRRAFRGTQQEQ